MRVFRYGFNARGQIKGDSPELVEYTGMKNLINDVEDSVKASLLKKMLKIVLNLRTGSFFSLVGLMFSKLRRTIRAFERTFNSLFVHVGSVWSKPTRETRFGSKQTASGCESKQGA
ncbi:hypothetical protein IGI04_031055 [Brassica rapa subsp. trilocularis]|uniref:Uncharacterized protein n=1 Tax=Brassica rapa subsp. trilocularis TaxID=1813537 RepID=A0ABQ7LSI4_BRACM|nr:hypothetical protein IGI04_031055 [Brassica rapa subsp. trilocularis]